MAKNKGLDNDDSNGRCLGWQCLRVVGQCRASRRYHDLRRPRPRPRHAATVTVTAGHWHAGRSQSKPDSSEYLQRVKFQSKSRDNTTASLRGKKLKLAKVEGRADGPGRRPPSESREDGTAPARRPGQAQRQNLKFYVQGPAT